MRAISAVTPIDYGYTRSEVVLPDSDVPRIRREQAQRAVEEALERLPSELHTEGRVADGDPVSVLTEEAGKGVDVLFVGSRGYGPVRRVLLGSVSGELIRSAPCPVVVMPRGIHQPEERSADATAARAD